MHAPIIRGSAALKLLDDAIAADHELELYRDVFQAVYGLTRYKEPYDAFFEAVESERVLDPQVEAYCKRITDPKPRS